MPGPAIRQETAGGFPESGATLTSGTKIPAAQRHARAGHERQAATRITTHHRSIQLDIDNNTRTEIEAAAFRRLLQHFGEHTDVQNIDLMNLASFCRNCCAKWYRAAAEERGVQMDYEQAREAVYGMPYGEWKKRYQSEASAEQKAAFDAVMRAQQEQ